MKNLRKLFTLVLALMILVSVFTLPAMAATVEHDHECEAASEIQPRYPVALCIECGGTTTFLGYRVEAGHTYAKLKCNDCGYIFEILYK